jgi:hypothetical protein
MYAYPLARKAKSAPSNEEVTGKTRQNIFCSDTEVPHARQHREENGPDIPENEERR